MLGVIGILFRVEDEERLIKSRRTYNRTYFEVLNEKEEISSDEADKYVADLIRKQVNGDKDSELFSSTTSLGLALFKYNKNGLNPIICSDLPPGLDNRLLTGQIEISVDFELPCVIEFTIKDLNSPIERWSQGRDVKIWQLLVPVYDNDLLDDYLFKYTGTHRKRVASPEKDMEIVSTDLSDLAKIDTYIDALYILYALHFRFKMLNDDMVYDLVDNYINHNIKKDDLNEFSGLSQILRYMKYSYDFEYKNSQKWIDNMIEEVNPVTEIYNGYSFANEILHVKDGNYTNNPLFVIKKYYEYNLSEDKLSNTIIDKFIMYLNEYRNEYHSFANIIDEYDMKNMNN